MSKLIFVHTRVHSVFFIRTLCFWWGSNFLKLSPFKPYFFLFFFLILCVLRLNFLKFFLNFWCSKAIFSYFFKYFMDICYPGLENWPHIVKIFTHFVLLCFFGILLAQNLQHIGIFKIFHILIKAQQVLNFLTSREFQPANFLKKFLHLVHFEPQFSYKWVLIKKMSVLPSSAQAPAKLGLSWLYSLLIQPPTHPTSGKVSVH